MDAACRLGKTPQCCLSSLLLLLLTGLGPVKSRGNGHLLLNGSLLIVSCRLCTEVDGGTKQPLVSGKRWRGQHSGCSVIVWIILTCLRIKTCMHAPTQHNTPPPRAALGAFLMTCELPLWQLLRHCYLFDLGETVSQTRVYFSRFLERHKSVVVGENTKIKKELYCNTN